MNDIVPVNEVAKRGVAAVGGIAGGIILFVLGSLPPVAGIIAGAVIGIAGIAVLSSKDPADKLPGLVTVAAGALAVVSRFPLVGGAARFLLGAGAAALLAVGIWNAIKFFKGMKSRS
ncbi:MAG: hypothetical protein LBP69_10095 [Treponema sp.]|jgi:hypothetical protein|nr:hypothetical protein [Treponema sp.]